MAETFGLTTKGGTEYNGDSNRIYGCKFTSGSAGTLESISLYVLQYFAATPHIKCAIYDADNNLLANGTTEEKVSPGDQDGWLVFNFPTPPSVAALTLYQLCWWADNIYKVFHNPGTVNQAVTKTEFYDGWPDPGGLGPLGDYEFSVYATYVGAANPPTAPTLLQVNGQSSPTGANCISDLTPEFSAIYNDPDAGDQSNAIQIQVGTASGLSDMWNSGWLADSTVTPNRCTAKTYAGAALSAGTSYWWRCRFRDDGGLEGAWSAWQQFDMCSALNLVQMALI